MRRKSHTCSKLDWWGWIICLLQESKLPCPIILIILGAFELILIRTFIPTSPPGRPTGKHNRQSPVQRPAQHYGARNPEGWEDGRAASEGLWAVHGGGEGCILRETWRELSLLLLGCWLFVGLFFFFAFFRVLFLGLCAVSIDLVALKE